jgi:two-component system, sensor histidine kinase RegB
MNARATADAAERTPVITGQWLVRFRWAVTAGATLALGITWTTLGLRFPLTVVAWALGIQLTSNVWLARRTRAGAGPAERTLGVVLLLDVALLTVLVLATGGPSNPFTISYLVYITLAAVTLRSRWTWAVSAACIGGYGLLFVTPLRAAVDPHVTHGAMLPGLGHQVGMWVAFFAAAALTATFVTRIRVALESRERALGEARRVAARQERLASLTTLAAGAAHELATPLATIATAAVELEHALATGAGPDAIVADARLVRSQVERCREILDQMSGRADPSIAQQPQSLEAAAIVAHALAGMSPAEQQQVRITFESGLPPVRLPLEAAARVVRSLIKNALHASADGQAVRVAVAQRDGAVRFEVRDDGSGMSPDVLARAGEPFYTTRPAGAGFGLGLFLVRTFTDQWGGRFQLSSSAGSGTTVTLDLPAERA